MDTSLIQLEGELYEAVQLSNLFHDSKTFVDASSKIPSDQILEAFRQARKDPLFDLKAFLEKYFEFPDRNYEALIRHINELWPKLARQADAASQQSTLIPLQQPYIVPGGRFREIFYWDSYYTSLGLIALQTIKTDSPLREGLPEAFNPELYVEGMLENYKELLKGLGLVPNGNRIYFQQRSQPPHLALYVELLWQHKYKHLEPKDQQAYLKDNLRCLYQEWQFWMQKRAVELELDSKTIKLNFFGSNAEKAAPREESYNEDLQTAQKAGWAWKIKAATRGADAAERQNASDIMRQLRAGAESGWDFSSRWFADPYRIETIQTTHYLPVDLNSLLFTLESTILELHSSLETLGSSVLESSALEEVAQQKLDRREALDKLFWSDEAEFYFDYNHVKGKRSSILAISGVAPLFTGATDAKRAATVAHTIKARLLASGGVRTTLEQTGQQWDAPNGWAPLQWQTIKGLLDRGNEYNNTDLINLAQDISRRWLETLRLNYASHNCLLEKYNVENTRALAEGGEYAVQEGFGWTNGVALALLALEEE